jgi:hypothetical protein
LPTQVTTHDVEPDEGIAVAIQCAGNRGDDLTGALRCEERLGVGGKKPLSVVASRIPAFGGSPLDRSVGRASARGGGPRSFYGATTAGIA